MILNLYSIRNVLAQGKKLTIISFDSKSSGFDIAKMIKNYKH